MQATILDGKNIHHHQVHWEAISNFPMPEKPTITDIRSWCGLANQISPFFLSTGIMLPFASPLKHKDASSKYVYWDIHLENAFEASKLQICEQATRGLAYFDYKKKTCAITDWSKEGIGCLKENVGVLIVTLSVVMMDGK